MNLLRTFALSAVALVPILASACSADADASGSAPGDAVTIDGENEELGSCFSNTHSIGGRHICLAKQRDGRWYLDCLDGRRAIISDYNWALQWCDPNPPAAPPPPKPTTPGATCSSKATTGCVYRVNGRTVGVCTYTCSDGSTTRRFGTCGFYDNVPTCP